MWRCWYRCKWWSSSTLVLLDTTTTTTTNTRTVLVHDCISFVTWLELASIIFQVQFSLLQFDFSILIDYVVTSTRVCYCLIFTIQYNTIQSDWLVGWLVNNIINVLSWSATTVVMLLLHSRPDVWCYAMMHTSARMWIKNECFTADYNNCTHIFRFLERKQIEKNHYWRRRRMWKQMAMKSRW